MYNEYYTLRGLVLAEDKILTDGDKERLLKYLDRTVDCFLDDYFENCTKPQENKECIGEFDLKMLENLINYFDETDKNRYKN